jgi:hypothetical protein
VEARRGDLQMNDLTVTDILNKTHAMAPLLNSGPERPKVRPTAASVGRVEMHFCGLLLSVSPVSQGALVGAPASSARGTEDDGCRGDTGQVHRRL